MYYKDSSLSVISLERVPVEKAIALPHEIKADMTKLEEWKSF
jgi:hypothetical protein